MSCSYSDILLQNNWVGHVIKFSLPLSVGSVCLIVCVCKNIRNYVNICENAIFYQTEKETIILSFVFMCLYDVCDCMCVWIQVNACHRTTSDVILCISFCLTQGFSFIATYDKLIGQVTVDSFVSISCVSTGVLGFYRCATMLTFTGILELDSNSGPNHLMTNTLPTEQSCQHRR